MRARVDRNLACAPLRIALLPDFSEQLSPYAHWWRDRNLLSTLIARGLQIHRMQLSGARIQHRNLLSAESQYSIHFNPIHRTFLYASKYVACSRPELAERSVESLHAPSPRRPSGIAALCTLTPAARLEGRPHFRVRYDIPGSQEPLAALLLAGSFWTGIWCALPSHGLARTGIWRLHLQWRFLLTLISR